MAPVATLLIVALGTRLTLSHDLRKRLHFFDQLHDITDFPKAAIQHEFYGRTSAIDAVDGSPPTRQTVGVGKMGANDIEGLRWLRPRQQH